MEAGLASGSHSQQPLLEPLKLESTDDTSRGNNIDMDLPCLTFRFWVLASFFTILSASVAQFYFFRANTIVFSVFFVQLASYLLGTLMARTLPTTQYMAFGLHFTFNPGPFNIKEHMLIGVAAGTSSASAYAIDVISVQKLFYNQNLGWFADIMLLFTTQCLGYGIAGMLRNFLVYNDKMIWPSTLVNFALYQTLHKEGAEYVSLVESELDSSPSKPVVLIDNTDLESSPIIAFAIAERDRSPSIKSEDEETRLARNQPTSWTVSKMTFFKYVFFCIMVYEILPQYIAPIMASMTLLCWMNPSSKVLQLLGSGFHGLGIGALSLDWNVIGTLGPLFTPWWAQVNLYIGLVLMLWIVTPILYFSDLWQAHLYGIVSPGIYTIAGQPYNISRVLTADHILDEQKYQEYGELRMSPYFAITYGISFLSFTATLSHVVLWYGKDIYSQLFTKSTTNQSSTPIKSMYPEVPAFWYLGMFVSCLVMAIFICEYTAIQLPWWALLLAIGIALTLSLPIGIIQAISSTQIGLNVVTEFVCGYLLVGQPIANLVFKTYGYMAMSQCLSLVSDLKLGYYMKIPPKVMFVVQLFGTLVGAVVNYTVMLIIIHSRNLLEPDPTGQWDPRNSKIFFSASIIWGAIGPARMFGTASIYHPVLYCFFLGILLPVPFWLLHKRFPKSPLHFNLVNIPIIAAGASLIPQYPANFILSSMIVATLSQFYAHRYHHGWWSKYNYVMSAALDAGSAIASMGMFLITNVLLDQASAKFPEWLGNSYTDSEQCSL